MNILALLLITNEKCLICNQAAFITSNSFHSFSWLRQLSGENERLIFHVMPPSLLLHIRHCTPNYAIWSGSSKMVVIIARRRRQEEQQPLPFGRSWADITERRQTSRNLDK